MSGTALPFGLSLSKAFDAVIPMPFLFVGTKYAAATLATEHFDKLSANGSTPA